MRKDIIIKLMQEKKFNLYQMEKKLNIMKIWQTFFKIFKVLIKLLNIIK
jgi:hypothetical protein